MLAYANPPLLSMLQKGEAKGGEAKGVRNRFSPFLACLEVGSLFRDPVASPFCLTSSRRQTESRAIRNDEARSIRLRSPRRSHDQSIRESGESAREIQRGQVHYVAPERHGPLFLGLPRGRTVDSKANSFTVDLIHSSEPNG
jgi:hypothetical protein